LAQARSAWTSAAEAAVRAGNDVLAADDRGVTQDAVVAKLGVLDKVGGIDDDAWHQDLASRQLRISAMRAIHARAAVGGFEGISLRLYLRRRCSRREDGRR